MIIGANEYAVVIPIVNKKYFLFEVRSKKLNTQPGEVAFPGGKLEENESPKDCAIRETIEEIGTVPKIIKDLPMVVTPFNIVIYPFLGTINSKIMRNKSEVDAIFLAPIKLFEKPLYEYYIDVKVYPPTNFPFHLIPNEKNYNWRQGKYRILFFKHKEYIIWGITALIAHEAYKILKEESI
ncbi:NUDIX hydrolase [Thermosipho sp. 1063]|uniref:NUDIX hydrolase n=1 Tax=unclassified Thermosipho (in: thermotogales) TaxID=2676525 RepID=UPI0009494572|nr:MULTISPECIES: CoA pyrophosphatase [unclassified Thermosipho (in: thermotogales)]ANQ53115.1 NUDIX hydrolase [Thermosipho sp. 1070]APT71564.1 NUDIX hydrolase [Thermosipho sp. 1063]OOC45640.1 NUDIX hydrolase [Thermosipho sp. 1074]